MPARPRSTQLPDGFSDSVTGTTVNAYAAAYDWRSSAGWSDKSFNIANTGDTNSLTYKILLYSNIGGYEFVFSDNGQTEFTVSADDTDLVCLNYAYDQIVVQVKSTVADSATTYQVDVVGDKGGTALAAELQSVLVVPAPEFGSTASTGTLNDANTSDDIETTKDGAIAWIGISLENMVNSDDFDIALQRYSTLDAAWVTYITYNVTMTGGSIYMDSGAGAVLTNTTEISFENIYIDSARALRLAYTKNSVTDRDFTYWYNLWE